MTTTIHNNDITCMKWHDKRIVNMLSTYHGNEMIVKERRSRKVEGGTEKVKKPRMIQDYNKHMGGVDKNDQMVLYYAYSHRFIMKQYNYYLLYHFRSRKWWRCLFFDMMDVSLVNAYILYNRDKDRSSRVPLLEFRVAVATGLLEQHQHRTDRRHAAPMSLPMRLYETRPFPEKTPTESEFGGRPLCKVCKSKGLRSQTTFRCKTCKTPLHCHPCMELYHTKKDYTKFKKRLQNNVIT